MPRTKISEFSATPANNTDIDSINIAENCPPSGINDAIRELMAQLKDFQTGAVGDSFNGPVGTSTAAAGAFTTLAASGAVTLSGGTANGVAYLNGSKVVSSSATLTWNNSTQQLGFQNAAASGYAYIGTAGAGSNTDLAFYMGASEGMRLTSTGLGIGTSSPASKLAVVGEARVYTGSNLGYWGVDGGNSYVYFGTNSSGYSLSFQTGGSDRMRLDSSGKLGLGMTPSGSYSLQIYGVGASAGSARIRLNNSSTGTADADGGGIAMEGVDLVIQNSENGVCKWEINGSERARIDSSGNLLVGTTSSEGNAKIVTISSTNGVAARTTATANSYEAIVASRTSTVGKAITLWYDLNLGIQSGFINIDSTSTVSLNNTSDYRAKENIQPLVDSIQRVKNLKPVSFNFKADGYFAEGFIAHEFAEVIPQAVHGVKDAVDENGKPVYQAIDQSKIVPLLTAAIQEQQAIIESLKARLDAANL